VQWQLETLGNPGLRNEFCRSLITRKIEASILTLEKSIRRSDKWERAMKSAYAALNPPRRKSARSHFRIARIGSQLRGVLFSQLGRHDDQMARRKPQANSRQLA
jgi:CRISPR-associated protein Cas1